MENAIGGFAQYGSRQDDKHGGAQGGHDGPVPIGAMRGDVDVDGAVIFHGRTYLEGDIAFGHGGQLVVRY